MSTTRQPDDQPTIFDAPRQLRLVPGLPDGRNRRAFQAQLQKRGLSEESAAAAARAVVMPDVALAHLNSPTSYRIPGAELLVIRVEVYSSRVIPDATNPRTLNDVFFPAAVAPGDQRALYPPLEPPTSNASDFTITVLNWEQLTWQLDRTMAATLRANTPRPPISQQGVMEPPLAVPARIVDRSGAALGGAVLVREGSTRVSHVLKIHGVDAAAVLRHYTDDRKQRELIDELNAIAQRSAASISDSDAGRIRVATMPMDLVVGVNPDEGTDATLGEAVAAKVAQDHLNHKKEWQPAAKEVHLGEQCLVALHEESLLTDDEKAWLAGRFTPQQPVNGEIMDEDDRWARLIWLFTTRSRPVSVVVRRPIATVLEREEGRKRISRIDRIRMAVALAMRSRRGVITETAVDKASKLLENTVPGIVWEATWQPTSKTVEDLVSEAAEAAANRVTDNAAAAELAVRAAWYLAKNGQISMPRNDLGPGGDRRSPADLMDGMLASPRGIRQLGQAIIDGRDGDKAGFVVDDDGTVDRSGVGTPVPLNDDAVRTTLVPRSGPPAPPPRDPHGEFMDAIAALGRAINAAQNADQDLRQVEDGHGQPMVEVEGVDRALTNDFREKLEELSANLNEYAMNWRVVQQTRPRSSGDA